METLATTVGSSVAKWIIGTWLGDGLTKELSSGLVDVITPKVPDFFQRRRIERQMQLVAETSAEKLAQLIETEFRSLEQGEQASAVLAAGETLQVGLAVIDLTALDFDPARLKEELMQVDGGRTAKSGLSETGCRLYSLLISESCSYIVEVVTALPAFSAAASLEILRRETTLIDMVREIYEKLPDPGAAAERAAAVVAEFETHYRRYIARRLDRLELFGLSVSEFSSRYALSVAYITLSVRGRSRDVHFNGEGKASAAGIKVADDGLSLRIDDAIGPSSRVFVRGAAGSGKTTLMQWIAVNSARSEFEGAMEDWNGTVPFFLQLRRFGKGALPSPSDFLSFAGPGISGRVPEGWVLEQLIEGRAVLLIDGVDEVAEADRARVRRWLEDLLAAYPDCRYVVTSRPAAVTADWLEGELFDTLDLQPMTMADIQQFVSHWHQAAARNSSEDEQLAQLVRYQATLTETISSNRQIRSLATTPLLCAMLCALNRDRRTQLPKDRVELYRIALEMLLERRDLEREIDISHDPVLSLPEKLILLRELAYWLVLNEQSDADYDMVLQRFEHRLLSMPGVMAGPKRVLKYLLVRSGLLREPVQGRIDFIHRTFQEYLAAVEVSELGNIPMLLTRAAEDNWREVVVLTAGTCHSRQKADLLRGLLRRGANDPENQHTFYLLAVACLETAREVPPDLVADISDCLNALLPPSNVTEAKELASAGELALARLREYTRAKAQESAACVRAACLIGGEVSLPVLRAFSSDPRKTVQRELIRSWSLHDMPAEYGEQVLQNAPLIDGHIAISDPSLLPHLHALKKMRSLEVTIRGLAVNLDLIRSYPQLNYFDARGSSEISDLSFLSESIDLQHLDLERCPLVSDLRPVAGARNMWLLDASGSQVRDISPISEMGRLHWLALRSCSEIEDWTPLEGKSELDYADFSHCAGLRDLAFTKGWEALGTLIISNTSVTSLSPLGRLQKLSTVFASFCEELVHAAGLSGAEHLSALDLSYCDSLTTTRNLTGLPRLMRLELNGCTNLVDIPLPAEVPKLRMLFLTTCKSLPREEFEALRDFSGLSVLYLGGTKFSQTSLLAHMRYLEHLSLDSCKEATDLSPLANLPSLKVLSIANVDGIDLRHLGDQSKRRLLVEIRRDQDVSGIEEFKKVGGRIRYYNY
ncbi:NACHT domain-containing protein [Micromonospora wenchangensis]|nr:NACHT domain-containing protein [Micromonospora wenchangensis]